MAGWYFSLNGKAEGPVSAEVLLEGLRSGRFTLVDLVFREGSAGWTTLGEIPEFRGAYQTLPPPTYNVDERTDPLMRIATPPKKAQAPEPPVVEPSPTSIPHHNPIQNLQMPPSPAWVVLRKKGTGFEQVGPYSESQILDRIGVGEIEYSMYAWKPGYKRWVRIGNLPEFDRRKRDRENDPVNQVVPIPSADRFSTGATPTREELAKSIEVHKRPDPFAQKVEPPPIEAKGVDLVEAHSPSSFRLNNAPIEREQKNQKTKSETTLERPVEPQKFELKADPKTDPRFESKYDSILDQKPEPVKPEPAPEPVPEPKMAGPSMVDMDRTVVNRSPRVEAPPPPVVEPEVPRVVPGLPTETIETHAEVAPNSSELAEVPVKKKRARLPFYQRAAIAIVAVGFLVFAVLAGAQWYNIQKTKKQAAADSEIVEAQPIRTKRQELPPEPMPAPESPEEAVEATTSTDSPSAEPEPAPPRTAAVNDLGLKPIPPSANGASVLDIVPMKLSSPNPLLVFQTDASVGETIEVRLKAKAGDILEWVSFSNTYMVRRSNGEIPSLDLTKFKLPSGNYRVDAMVGRVRKQATIFLGTRDASFEAERRDHMKTISQYQQAEKKALFYSAQRLEKLAGDLGDQAKKLKGKSPKWKKYYGDWRKQVKAAAKPAMRFVKSDRPEMVAYADLFLTFDQLNDDLLEQAREVDASFTQKRAPSNVPLPVARGFKKLRIEASKLSSSN